MHTTPASAIERLPEQIGTTPRWGSPHDFVAEPDVFGVDRGPGDRLVNQPGRPFDHLRISQEPAGGHREVTAPAPAVTGRGGVRRAGRRPGAFSLPEPDEASLAELATVHETAPAPADSPNAVCTDVARVVTPAIA